MRQDEYKLLVVSDVHGHLMPLRWVLANETADALFFLGDGLQDLDQALAQLHTRLPYPVYRVRGNCDPGYQDPIEGLAPFGGVLFFYTHGHHYGVKAGYGQLAEYAQARGADVALFGHTHCKTYHPATLAGPALFNPGSLRDSGTYGVITVQNQTPHFGWKRVPEF